jgi:hypothetical protein
VDIDPVATLRCWSVIVDVAGQEYTIPSLPASAWLLAMLEGGWIEIVPGLIGESRELPDEVVDGRVSYEECKAAAKAALCTAAGTRKWWAASSLAKASLMSWVAGDLLLHGVDLDRVSLAGYLAAAYRAATVNMDQQTRGRFGTDLNPPPPGLPPEEWFDADEAEQGFLALMSADGAGQDDEPS